MIATTLIFASSLPDSNITEERKGVFIPPDCFVMILLFFLEWLSKKQFHCQIL